MALEQILLDSSGDWTRESLRTFWKKKTPFSFRLQAIVRNEYIKNQTHLGCGAF